MSISPYKLASFHLLSWSRPIQRMAANQFPPEVKINSTGNGSEPSRDPNLNPAVTIFRQLMGSSATDGWDKCWNAEITPWDLGQATPIVTHLVETGKLPNGRILVPGCGTGYDVVAMATPERFVVGLDISKAAVSKAKEWSFSLPNAKYFNFLAEDFFTWTTAEQFDVVFDYTFFCAIHPTLRPAWAKKVSEFLKPDGELITLMYLFDDQEVGPPYSTSVADYSEVLNPVGFKAISIVDNELAVKPRKGSEKLGRWRRSSNQSSL